MESPSDVSMFWAPTIPTIPTILKKPFQPFQPLQPMFKKLLLLFLIPCFASGLFAQNTLPSCVITMPHSNAYFQQGTDIHIKVYATDFGGSYAAGSVTKVEFFSNDEKLGESTSANAHTYTWLWEDVPAGNYRITAKATDNENAESLSAGVLITVGANPVKPVGLSAGKGKYLGNINGFNRTDYLNYWNAVTAENANKWGSIEGTRNVMNWFTADRVYNFARDNNLVFRYHVLAWGSQYPSWITTLTPEEFQKEMEEYMAAVAQRYPLIDQVEVLNENMYLNTWNGLEHAAGTPYFRAGLGGPGETGYDWVIWLFEKARHYFPNSKLIMNDFELETNMAGINEMLAVIKVLRDRNLIDGFGTQAHYFNVDGITKTNLQNALNNMAKGGIPIYVTELDLRGKTISEAGQLASYQTAFPVYWDHPAVAGITLWGYVEGTTWATGTGILTSNGTERSAMTWLKSYMASLPDVGYPFSSFNTSMDVAPATNSFRIYPNPAKNTVFIDGLQQPVTISIRNITGQEVLRTDSNGVVDVSGLARGVYLLKAGTEKPLKFIKE
jgi:GH35 family endo-1,4-beta-xylanase